MTDTLTYKTLKTANQAREAVNKILLFNQSIFHYRKRLLYKASSENKKPCSISGGVKPTSSNLQRVV